MFFLLNLPKGKVKVTGDMSPLRLEFSPHTFNQICNIDKLLITDDRGGNLEHQLVNEKAQVIKCAVKIGVLKVTGDQKPFFAVLSGPYLYFYDDQSS